MLRWLRRSPAAQAADVPLFHSVLTWERDHVRAAVVKLSHGIADVLGTGVSPVHGLGRAQYPDPERWLIGADLALTQAEDMTEHGNYQRKVVADSVTMSVPDAVTLAMAVSPRRERSHPSQPIKHEEIVDLLRRGYREALDRFDDDKRLERNTVTCGSVGQIRLDGRDVLDPEGLQGTLLEADMCFFAVPIEWVRTIENLSDRLETSLSSIVPQRLAIASSMHDGLLVLVGDDQTHLDLVRQGRIAWSVCSKRGAAGIIEATLAGLPVQANEHQQVMQQYRSGNLQQQDLDLIAARYWAALKTWMTELRDAIPPEERARSLPETHYGLDLSHRVPEALLALETPFWEEALCFSRCPRLTAIENLKNDRVMNWTRQAYSPALLPVWSLAYYAARQFGPSGDLDQALLSIIDWRGAA